MPKRKRTLYVPKFPGITEAVKRAASESDTKIIHVAGVGIAKYQGKTFNSDTHDTLLDCELGKDTGEFYRLLKNTKISRSEINLFKKDYFREISHHFGFWKFLCHQLRKRDCVRFALP